MKNLYREEGLKFTKRGLVSSALSAGFAFWIVPKIEKFANGSIPKISQVYDAVSIS